MMARRLAIPARVTFVESKGPSGTTRSGTFTASLLCARVREACARRDDNKYYRNDGHCDEDSYWGYKKC
jgi:hypothetical protein